MITSQLVVTSLLAVSGVFALPDIVANSQLETCSSDVASCKGYLIKHKLRDFCKADLALYTKNKCTFKTNSIGRVTLPPSISQYAQTTVLQACAEFLKVSVPTCAPSGIQNACFSKTATLPSDPNQLQLCQHCSCKYVTGVTSDTTITNPMAIQCTYNAIKAVDYFRLNPSIDFSGQGDTSNVIRFQGFGGLGGSGPGNPDLVGAINNLQLYSKGTCTSTLDCSIYVGSKGNDAPTALTTTVDGVYGGGGSSTGGASGGGASYVIQGGTSVAPNPDYSNILIVSGGGGGTSAQGGAFTFQDKNVGSFLQGAMGENGGGGGGGGIMGGLGGNTPTDSGGEGARYSRPNSNGAKVGSVPFDGAQSTTGDGIMYVSFGCVGSPDTCIERGC